jgi:hypothetical protein
MTVLAWAVPVLALGKEERLLLWVGVLASVLVIGGLIIGRLDRWRKRQMETEDDSPEHIGSFRSMYERGELSKEEYERVLWRMAERAGSKARPASTATTTPPPTPPSNPEPPGQATP